MPNLATRTVLLCDAAFSAVPILFALKKRGYRVAVCGARPNDPGHGLADLSFVMDYSDKELLLQTVTKEGIDVLVPGCTDVSYLSCAWVARQLGLAGFDTLESSNTIHRKDAFRKFCRSHRFPTPRSASSPSELSMLNFPILIKPADSFSGRGIVKVEKRDDVGREIQRMRSKSAIQSVVFEEFVEGNLYSHSAFIRDEKIVADFFVNEYCTVHPYQVNSSHVCVDLDARVVEGLRQWLERFAAILGLADGLVHTQFISDGKAFYLIEVMRRCPGDLYSMLIENSIGVDYPALYGASFCGCEVEVGLDAPVKRFFSRHTVSVGRDCFFVSSSMALPRARVSFVPLKRTGEMLRAAPMDRAGIYFSEHQSSTEMKEITPTLKDRVTVETAGRD
jgi:biotin carboxylase